MGVFIAATRVTFRPCIGPLSARCSSSGGSTWVFICGHGHRAKKWRTVCQKVTYSGPNSDVRRAEKWRTGQNATLECSYCTPSYYCRPTVNVIQARDLSAVSWGYSCTSPPDFTLTTRFVCSATCILDITSQYLLLWCEMTDYWVQQFKAYDFVGNI